MARRLIINRLDKDELTYELTFRGISLGSCDEMRHRLSSAIQLERDGDSLHYPDYPFSFEEDETAVKKSLQDVMKLVDNLTGNRTSSDATKIQNKFTFLLNRLDRMTATSVVESTRKADLTAMTLSAMNKFNTKLNDIDITNRPVPVSLTHLQARTFDPPASSSIVEDISFTQGAHKIVPPHKWDLKKFSGDSKGMSVTAFFERVEELRVARNVPKAMLLDTGVDLFADKAYQFYKDCRTRLSSWDELVEEFRTEYLTAHHLDALFEELQKRTQHPSESIGVYLAVMTSYFNRLRCSMSEDAKLKVIMRNLHPFYLDRLRDPPPSTIAELREQCRKMEDRRDLINNYVEPSTRRAGIMERDLAYVGDEEDSRISEVASTQAVPSPNSRSVVCFRCKQPGHRAIGCALPRPIKCFKCQREGFTVRNCPNCNKGNDGRRS